MEGSIREKSAHRPDQVVNRLQKWETTLTTRAPSEASQLTNHEWEVYPSRKSSIRSPSIIEVSRLTPVLPSSNSV